MPHRINDLGTVFMLIEPKIVKLWNGRWISIYHQSNGRKAAKRAWESGWRSPFALLLVDYRLFKSLSVYQ